MILKLEQYLDKMWDILSIDFVLKFFVISLLTTCAIFVNVLFIEHADFVKTFSRYMKVLGWVNILFMVQEDLLLLAIYILEDDAEWIRKVSMIFTVMYGICSLLLEGILYHKSKLYNREPVDKEIDNENRNYVKEHIFLILADNILELVTLVLLYRKLGREKRYLVLMLTPTLQMIFMLYFHVDKSIHYRVKVSCPKNFRYLIIACVTSIWHLTYITIILTDVSHQVTIIALVRDIVLSLFSAVLHPKLERMFSDPNIPW